MPLDPQRRDTPPPVRFNFLYAMLIVWVIIFVTDFIQLRRNFETIPYSQFIQNVKDKKISEVTISSQRIEGKYVTPTGPQGFSAHRVEDPKLTELLSASNIKFSGTVENTFFRDILSWVLPLIVFFGLFQYLSRRMGNPAGRGGGFLTLGKSKAKVYVETDLKIRFDDVAGVDEAKAELREIVDFLKDPTGYSRLGGRMPKGILLVGPPGTGKTLMARAVAGEAQVPFFSINGSEFVELFVGLGAARVRDLFEQARAKAPCIIFIDELDALGKARGINILAGSGGDEKEQTLNQLLAELDGFDPSTGIILLAATNRPEVLDPALLRAGRFDRQVVLDKPDRGGRKKILEIHMRKIRAAPDADLDALASLTAGFSGADLANLVNEAALIATRRKAETVELRDCTQAIERIVAGLERKTRVLSPDEKRRVAYHEMGHATVGLALGSGETVHKVSIIPRGMAALGYTIRRPTEDRYLMSQKELQEKIAVLLGGRASEQMFLGDISTGAADDLDRATEIARAMVMRYGMSQKLGAATFEREQSPFLGGQAPIRVHDFGEHTAQITDEEIRRIISEGITAATAVVQQYRSLIEEAMIALLSKETLDEDELRALWEKHSQKAGPRAIARVA